MESVNYRTVELDADNRRVYHGGDQLFCVKCNKPIKGKARSVHVIGGGALVLHPDDEQLYTSDAADMGYFLIGPDCAKKLGLEWSTPAEKGKP